MQVPRHQLVGTNHASTTVMSQTGQAAFDHRQPSPGRGVEAEYTRRAPTAEDVALQELASPRGWWISRGPRLTLAVSSAQPGRTRQRQGAPGSASRVSRPVAVQDVRPPVWHGDALVDGQGV